MRTGEKAHKDILRVVRVLIFVHHDVSESVLIVFSYFAVLLKQTNRIDNNIIKIHCVRVFQTSLIALVELRYLAFSRIVRFTLLQGKLIRFNQAILSF